MFLLEHISHASVQVLHFYLHGYMHFACFKQCYQTKQMLLYECHICLIAWSKKRICPIRYQEVEKDGGMEEASQNLFELN